MRVLIPSAHTPVWRGGEIEFIDPGDDEAYWRWWRAIWARAEGVIVVEHDITPSAEALEDIEGCGRDWCAQPYPYLRGGTHYGLGCVKFTAEIMRGAPDLWDQVGRMSDRAHPARHWCRLDAWARGLLEQAGYRRCNHAIPVEHPERGGSSHGCC